MTYNDVELTSMRRDDVASTLIRCQFGTTGHSLFQQYCQTVSKSCPKSRFFIIGRKAMLKFDHLEMSYILDLELDRPEKNMHMLYQTHQNGI